MDENELLAVMYTGAMLVFVLMLVLRRMLPERAKAKSGEPEPICRCKHWYSFHSPEDGRCSRLRKIESKWDRDGDAIAFEYIRCECHVYDGPLPGISPQIMRELQNPSPSIEPYSQDK